MKNLKLFIPFILFAVLAVLLLKGLGRDPSVLPSALIDRPMPAFSLPDLHDPERQLTQDIFKGHVSLLNVWATWCPSCRVEHPFFMALAEKGVRIVGMDYKDQDPLALEWLDKLGNPYAQIFVDREGALGIDLGVFGAPETYLIDHTGTIRAKHVGVVDETVWKELGALYRQLVKESEGR